MSSPRSSDEQGAALQRYFDNRLVTPDSLGDRPISVLQRKGFLSFVKNEDLDGGEAPAMTASQRQQFEAFHDLPPDYLAILGREPTRNARILQRLLKLGQKRSVLVFACSVEHAEI